MGQTSEKPFDAQFSQPINAITTDFVLKRFENKIFLIITQYGKMCNLYTVTFDAENPMAITLDPTKVPITILHNFGEDTDEYRSVIQFLVNNSNLKESPTEILISIGLKEISGKNLKCIAAILNTVLNFKNSK